VLNKEQGQCGETNLRGDILNGDWKKLRQIKAEGQRMEKAFS
jgi:hypothetical protein